MALLTFKDVGQGDSIILEWETDGKPHIGIFDCNRKGKTNPVLQHIVDRKYQHIDFLILSHPHEDHYSGFTELLEYCEATGVSIGWFGDTAFHLGRFYWKQFEIGHDATQELERFLNAIARLSNAGVIGRRYPLGQGWSRELAPALTIRVLSPGMTEMQDYQQKVQFDAGANKKAASQAANLLSTVFLISAGTQHALVTSDAVSVTFDRIHSEADLAAIPLVVVQAPHHGSKKNYSAPFWSGLVNAAGRRAVVSSGFNDKYKHPHLEVLTGLTTLGFAVHATNIIYGMREYISIREKTIVLDMASDLVDRRGGDKVFDLSMP